MESITKSDYKLANNSWNIFNMKNLGDYHDLYVQCDILLLANVFENFRQKYIEIYQIDVAYFYASPGLA